MLEGIMQGFMSFGAKAAYTVVLSVIVVLCGTEIFKLWFDRSLALTVFEFTKDGVPAAANGEAFTRRIEQQQRVLKTMFEGPRRATGNPILTEEVVSQFSVGNLNAVKLSASELADLKIEAQGINLTAILGRLRNWIRQPSVITGRVDQIGDTYHVFAEWRGRQGTSPSAVFYNRAHDSPREASFQIAARLLFQEFARVEQPTGLAKRLVEDLSPDDFVAFLDAWMVYRWPDSDPAKQKKRLESALGSLAALIARDGTFPLVHKLAVNLKLNAKSLDDMTETEKAEIQDLLEKYVAAIQALKLEDRAARDQLASLARGEQAAQRVAQAVREIRAEAAVGAASLPRQVALAGGSISPAGLSRSTGSACCIVRNDAGDRFVVTADYLFPPEILAKDPNPAVLSPAALDGGTEPVGRLEKIHRLPNGVAGIALVRLNDDVEGRNTLPAGKSITSLTADYQPGDTVALFGRTSQGARGKIIEQGNVASQIRQQVQKMAPPPIEGLVGIERISRPGDGGAPVLDAQGRLLGMAYSATPELSLVLPLASLFQELGLRLVAE